jgi:hypothetical protein
MQLCHILGEFKQIFVSSSSNSSTERIKATIVSSIKSEMDLVPCLTEIRASRCNRGSCRVQYQFDSEQAIQDHRLVHTEHAQKQYYAYIRLHQHEHDYIVSR